MTYQDTLKYMFEHLPMFHRVGKSAYKANLDNALSLDAYFNYCHKNYRTIHVAGTNGKGSVSHMLSAVLQTVGYKTGLFTSPHLKDFRERIRVNGEMIPEFEVVEFIEANKQKFEVIKPSFFEMTSALAFYYFSKVKVDVAVIEVGMGGRLDSTNVITPVLSIITNIGLDHTEFLGNTLSSIAKEKAGIMKENIPVVIGEYNEETWPVFKSCADAKQSKISLADHIYRAEQSVPKDKLKQGFNVFKENRLIYRELEIDLLGFYQKKNICTVLASLDVLNEADFKISQSCVYTSIANAGNLTHLQGRWQQIGENPTIICDTGHNTDGISQILAQIQSLKFKKLHIVIGFVNDKDVHSILNLLPADAVYYFTQANIPRAMDAKELMQKAAGFNLQGEFYSSVASALNQAKRNADKDDFVFVGGSTFIVAEVV